MKGQGALVRRAWKEAIDLVVLVLRAWKEAIDPAALALREICHTAKDLAALVRRGWRGKDHAVHARKAICHTANGLAVLAQRGWKEATDLAVLVRRVICHTVKDLAALAQRGIGLLDPQGKEGIDRQGHKATDRHAHLVPQGKEGTEGKEETGRRVRKVTDHLAHKGTDRHAHKGIGLQDRPGNKEIGHLAPQGKEVTGLSTETADHPARRVLALAKSRKQNRPPVQSLPKAIASKSGKGAQRPTKPKVKKTQFVRTAQISPTKTAVPGSLTKTVREAPGVGEGQLMVTTRRPASRLNALCQKRLFQPLQKLQ